nr:VanZ family protein [uncultured Butyrivibrio sp.]
MNMLEKRIRQVLPIVIMLIVIAVLTTQSPSETISVSRGLQDLCKGIIPNASGRWTTDMHWFRSLLHLPLYFVLGIIAAFSFRQVWVSLGICSFIALADETLKIFLPTREFEVRDIIFDAIGFLVGIGVVVLCRWLGSKHKSRGARPFSEIDTRDT